jgi:hypothetical protein
LRQKSIKQESGAPPRVGGVPRKGAPKASILNFILCIFVICHQTFLTKTAIHFPFHHLHLFLHRIEICYYLEQKWINKVDRVILPFNFGRLLVVEFTLILALKILVVVILQKHLGQKLQCGMKVHFRFLTLGQPIFIFSHGVSCLIKNTLAKIENYFCSFWFSLLNNRTGSCQN